MAEMLELLRLHVSEQAKFFPFGCSGLIWLELVEDAWEFLKTLKSRALIQTPNSRALVLRNPT